MKRCCWRPRPTALDHRQLDRLLAGLGRRDPAAIHFTRNVLLGFLPSAVIGAIAYSAIKALLNQPIVVAVALLVGGVAMPLNTPVKSGFQAPT